MEQTATTAQEQIALLVGEFGEDQVRQAAEVLLQVKAREIPAEHMRSISPEQLADTIYQLDVALREVESAGKAKELAYEGKRDLVKRKPQAEAAVNLKQAEAFMLIQGTGKDAYGLIGEVKMPLGNEEQRKAYQRLYAQAETTSLAELEGQLNHAELDVLQKNDAYYSTKEQVETLRSKAALQAAILTFLSSRG